MKWQLKIESTEDDCYTLFFSGRIQKKNHLVSRQSYRKRSRCAGIKSVFSSLKQCRFPKGGVD